jgi:hypothetical protein
MSFHSIDTLQSWVREFERSHDFAGSIRVIPQDGEEGDDTGLVAMRLDNSPTEIYLEPPGANGQPRWTVVFEARELPVRLTSDQVITLAQGLKTLTALCSFLELKSDRDEARCEYAPRAAPAGIEDAREINEDGPGRARQ